NGKLDRRALPAPEWYDRGPTAKPPVLPRTPLEQLIADIWQDVLGIDQLGVDDDFFLLGGHSLLATQVIARVRDAVRVDVPLRALFDTPTIAGLAECLFANEARPGQIQAIVTLHEKVSRMSPEEVTALL